VVECGVDFRGCRQSGWLTGRVFVMRRFGVVGVVVGVVWLGWGEFGVGGLVGDFVCAFGLWGCGDLGGKRQL
jgi:hypothetical protein